MSDLDDARLRAALARLANEERPPARDRVPSAVKRLRLRGHAIGNVNEFFEGLVAFVRGFASLVSAAERRPLEPPDARARSVKDEPHG